MENLSQFADITGLGVAALALVVLLVVVKGKKAASQNSLDVMHTDLVQVKENHLTHIQADINRLLDGNSELLQYQQKQVYILEEIRNLLNQLNQRR